MVTEPIGCNLGQLEMSDREDTSEIGSSHAVLMELQKNQMGMVDDIKDIKDVAEKWLRPNDRMVDDIRDIKVALMGNDLHPEGLVQRVAAHDKRIDLVERRMDRASWTAVGAALGGAVGGGAFVTLIAEIVGNAT